MRHRKEKSRPLKYGWLDSVLVGCPTPLAVAIGVAKRPLSEIKTVAAQLGQHVYAAASVVAITIVRFNGLSGWHTWSRGFDNRLV